MTNDEPSGTGRLPAAGRVSANIGARLAARERSRAWLARRLEVSGMWLHRRLSGATPWGVDDLEAVARVLGCEPEDLLVDVPTVEAVGA